VIKGYQTTPEALQELAAAFARSRALFRPSPAPPWQGEYRKFSKSRVAKTFRSLSVWVKARYRGDIKA